MMIYIAFILWVSYCVYEVYQYRRIKKLEHAYFCQDEPIFNVFISFMILLMMLIVMFGIVHKGNIGKEISRRTEHIKIASVRNIRDISGSFFLGTGNIDSKNYYIYLKAMNDGSFKQDRVLVDHSRIYETSELTPRIQWSVVRRRSPLFLRTGFECFDTYESRSGDYVIIVPENTVIHSFQVN